MQGRQGKADPDSCIFITLFFFSLCFRSSLCLLPLVTGKQEGKVARYG